MRRHLKFGLRTLLLVTLSLCVWLSIQTQKARQQRAVVTWIQQVGGTVHYDYECDGHGNLIANPRPRTWLQHCLGDDLFCGVEFVDLYGKQVNDSDLVKIGKLIDLRRLQLGHTQVKGSGVRHLKNLKAFGCWSLGGHI